MGTCIIQKLANKILIHYSSLHYSFNFCSLLHLYSCHVRLLTFINSPIVSQGTLSFMKLVKLLECREDIRNSSNISLPLLYYALFNISP
jgi:hypothetical protein